MKMPFGKYRDVELTGVPRPYLYWLRRQEWVGAWLVRAIDENLNGGPPGRPEATADAAEPNELGAFSVRHSGNIGQEILDQAGKIIAWTTDEWTAQVICKLLNENQELFRKKEKICH